MADLCNENSILLREDQEDFFKLTMVAFDRHIREEQLNVNALDVEDLTYWFDLSAQEVLRVLTGFNKMFQL